MIHHIYVITCLVDHRQYVGITSKNPYVRFGWHLADTNLTPLHAAMHEHGSINFTIEHIACCRTREDALAVEVELIEALNTRVPAGFNLGGRGGTKTPEHIAKVIAANNTPEARARHREGAIRRWDKPGSRAAQSLAVRTRLSDPEYRQRHLAQFKAASMNQRRGPGARFGRASSFTRHPKQGTLL